jgi:hypothetical protein
VVQRNSGLTKNKFWNSRLLLMWLLNRSVWHPSIWIQDWVPSCTFHTLLSCQEHSVHQFQTREEQLYRRTSFTHIINYALHNLMLHYHAHCSHFVYVNVLLIKLLHTCYMFNHVWAEDIIFLCDFFPLLACYPSSLAETNQNEYGERTSNRRKCRNVTEESPLSTNVNTLQWYKS